MLAPPVRARSPFAQTRLATVIVRMRAMPLWSSGDEMGQPAELSLYPAPGRFVFWSRSLSPPSQLFYPIVPLLIPSNFRAFTHSRTDCCSATSHSFRHSTLTADHSLLSRKPVERRNDLSITPLSIPKQQSACVTHLLWCSAPSLLARPQLPTTVTPASMRVAKREYTIDRLPRT